MLTIYSSGKYKTGFLLTSSHSVAIDSLTHSRVLWVFMFNDTLLINIVGGLADAEPQRPGGSRGGQLV